MDIDAFILIGGRSSRLGVDKAFVQFAGEMLAIRAARTIETALAPTLVTLVAAANDQFDPERLSTLGRPVIFDLNPGFGVWSGLHAALRSARKEWIFFSACDHPFMTAEFLKLLATKVADHYDAVVPRQPGGRLQPLCSFYRVSAALAIVDGILSNDKGVPALTMIFDSLRTHILEPEKYSHLENADKFFLNINTPSDLASAS